MATRISIRRRDVRMASVFACAAFVASCASDRPASVDVVDVVDVPVLTLASPRVIGVTDGLRRAADTLVNALRSVFEAGRVATAWALADGISSHLRRARCDRLSPAPEFTSGSGLSWLSFRDARYQPARAAGVTE